MLVRVGLFSSPYRFLSFVGGTLCEIGKPEMQQKINSFLEKEGIEKIAERLRTTVHTLQVIIDGLNQPESFDFRTGKQLNVNNSNFYLHSPHYLLWQQSYAIGKTDIILPFYTRENCSDFPSKSLQVVSRAKARSQVSRLCIPCLFSLTLD